MDRPRYTGIGIGHIDVARLLVDHGADVNARKQNNWAPIHLSALNECLDVVELLLARGANPHYLIDDGRSAFQLAKARGYREIVHLLREQDAKKLDVVRFLLDQRADLNRRRDKSKPGRITQNGHLDVTVFALFLLDCGADVDVQRDDLWTPLHLASSIGDNHVAELLVERGALVDSCNDQQKTPLDRPAGNGQVKVVHFLLESRANVHAVDKAGWTPLHTASRRGHLTVIKLLLSRVADIDSRTRANETAADLASEHKKIRAASFLVEYKGNENVRNRISSATLDMMLHDTRDEDPTEQTSLGPHATAEEG
ncbi:ankyrin repeat-containing domain protein [Lactifluus volemus]|nr:ankyrin repeat-containing domain protein [Lactifluus volemus]